MADARSRAESAAPAPAPGPAAPRRGEAERWLSLAVRTLHLVAVVALGAALLGAPAAPLAVAPSALAVTVSGAALLIEDRWAGRIALTEWAGAVVLAKLLAAGWVAWRPADGLAVFWVLLVLSSLSSHAPKRWRHRSWWPR